MVDKLAIIVPAYKPDFLRQALDSIENQTNKAHQVYIFDDASPFDLGSIIQPYLDRNGWQFVRFEENWGQKDLVGHWNRCVRMTSEPWVWLFSDDDLMEKSCVENFYQTMKVDSDASVFKFNLQIINEKSEVIDSNFPCPKRISGFDFGDLRFNRKLFSSAVEFIFRRNAFDDQNGFVNFPSGWCSDDASWIAFSGSHSIISMDNGLVFWRMSNVNISSKTGDFVRIKIDSSVQYMAWFNRRFPNRLTTSFQAEQIIWLRLQMVHLHYQPDFQEVILILSKLKIPFSSFWLRAFDDLYCLSYVYWMQVVKHQKPSGIRKWMHSILPKF